MFVIICVLLPRFALTVAAGGRDVLAAGPVALAPEPGREQFIGEVSAAAEAYGLHAGLRLGEALGRCPTLRLVAPDPAGVADAWDAHVAALEGIGAAVEAGPPGTAWFGAGGLKTLHGGTEPCSHRIPRVMPAVGHTLGAARPDAVHHIARAREDPGIEERVAVSSKKRRVVRPERDDVGDSTGHQPRRSDAKRRRAA